MSTEVKVKKEKKVKVGAEGGEVEVEKKVKKDKKRKAVELDLEPEVKEIPDVKTGGGLEVEVEAEETKEERKARKKAKKEAKAAAASSEDGPKLESALAAPTTSDPTPVKEETKEERKARRKAEKLAKEVANQPSTSEAEVPKPASVPEDEVSLKKKKAQAKAEGPSKAERKAKGAEKWSEGATELNLAMQARAEESPIWKDESLSEQAKKGLYYCELHAASQVKLQEPNYRWKFNKARQGWLMRNVWNETEVPEQYLDGVVNYLKTLPGSARTGMIATAKKYASATVKSAEEPAAMAEEEGAEAPEAPETKVEEDEAEGDKEDTASVEMRKARGQKILKALGAR